MFKIPTIIIKIWYFSLEQVNSVFSQSFVHKKTILCFLKMFSYTM